jgi:hypothetical protein
VQQQLVLESVLELESELESESELGLVLKLVGQQVLQERMHHQR